MNGFSFPWGAAFENGVSNGVPASLGELAQLFLLKKLMRMKKRNGNGLTGPQNPWAHLDPQTNLPLPAPPFINRVSPILPI